MNITSCPQCGGRVRSVSIGWQCESCQGLIDMRGQFHEHKEEPFMPPMTNADKIRAMSDEELAKFIATPCQCEVRPKRDGFRECGNDLCLQYLLKWLRQPAEEDT